MRTVCLALLLILLQPEPVKSFIIDPCCAVMAAGLSSIANKLNSVVGGGLNRIQSIEQSVQNFEQTVVWPVNLINQARALVSTLGNISTQIQGVMKLPVNSATRMIPQQLEQNLLSADASQIPNTAAAFTAVYGAVPNASQSSPRVQDMVDMSDAAAQDAMKRSIEIDNLANLEIRSANQLNQAIQNAAPGSAPILEAQADAWLVRANAYTQAATADLMRLRAVALANDSEELKIGAGASNSALQKLQKLLQ